MCGEFSNHMSLETTHVTDMCGMGLITGMSLERKDVYDMPMGTIGGQIAV